jgi:lipid A ethanolaminephosphotransferase
MGAPNADSLMNRPPVAAADVAMPVPRTRGAATLSRLRAARPAVTTEAMLLAAAIYLTAACNGPLWRGLLAGRPLGAPSTWGFAVAVGTACASATFVLLAVVSPRPIVKPLLTLVLLATSVAVHFMGAYGVILDTSMLRNLLHTDFAEARELVGRDILIAVLAYAAVPIALVWWPRLIRSPPRRAIARRVLAICGAWLLVVAALLPVYRDLASLIRNQPHLRNLLTPENYLFALGRALTQDTHRAALSRVPIGEDAHLGAAWQTRTRPVLFVLIVGETARADHFSLNGYARDTTPELARLGVVNFPNVTSCGTATEVSLPCMFSALGRSEYDGDRIRREEGLLNVLARAGLRVVWRDNQSGCKGVCDGKGIEFQSVRHVQLPGLCTSDGCLDEVLLKDLEATVASDDRSQVIVMHQLGNHGPAYFSRYPERFRRFVPTCDTPELRHCSREEIVNAYDNALAYTDHVVAETIEFLKARSDRYDTVLLYVSDHGESLGEHGLYLHGMPYAIVRRETDRKDIRNIVGAGWHHPRRFNELDFQKLSHGIEHFCNRPPLACRNIENALRRVFGHDRLDGR